MAKKNYTFEIKGSRGTTNVQDIKHVLADTAAEALAEARRRFKSNAATKDFIINSIKNITRK